ncbi:MAG: class I SAM-dependent methyltransferase [Polyangiaceae bacterium]
MKRDRELEACSQAHYADPAYYRDTYRERDEDVAYYLALALRLKRRGARVLEYGVGNGRIALPIARHGIGVTGVDLSGPMLADFRSTLAKEPGAVRDRVHLIRGDMRRVRLSQTFPLVLCTFNTILHLYTRRDIERFFDHVKAHLAPGGTFVCDLSMPMPEDLTRTFERPMKTPSFAHPSLGRVKYQERFEYDVTRQILFVSMEFSSKKGDLVTPLAHRQYFPQEFEALLHYNGFRVARCHGDFSGGPMNRQSETMIFHAKVR